MGEKMSKIVKMGDSGVKYTTSTVSPGEGGEGERREGKKMEKERYWDRYI